MKKKLALSFVLALTISGSIAAYAVTDKEISFRDVPWGVDMDTAEEALKEFEFSRSNYVGTAYKSDYYLNLGFKYARNEGTGTTESTYLGNSKTKVAGYDVSRIELTYANVFTGDMPDPTNCDTALYEATYSLECVDYELAGEDLRGKLSSLYGNEEFSNSENDTTTYVWYGANDTACALVIKLGSYPSININYVWQKGDDLIENADQAIENGFKAQESTIYGNGDNSGL